MGISRRTLMKNAAALGAFAGAGFPHIWIKNADLAYAAGGEIKVGVVNGKGVISDLKSYNSTPLFHG